MLSFTKNQITSGSKKFVGLLPFPTKLNRLTSGSFLDDGRLVELAPGEEGRSGSSNTPLQHKATSN